MKRSCNQGVRTCYGISYPKAVKSKVTCLNCNKAHLCNLPRELGSYNKAQQACLA